jgi:hypothetical protein
MSIKLTTLLGIAACALASTNGFALPVHDSHLIVAQNGMSGNDTRDSRTIQKQTNPRENGTSQSESRDGSNKNGQPQK